jgi:hypothetical protein
MAGVAGDDSRARRPRDYVIGGAWPDAEVSDHHGAQVAQHVARRLAETMRVRGLSAKRLGVLSGVNRQTIANVLAGSVWADLLTVANLEHALQQRLWPDPAGGTGAPAAPAAPARDGGLRSAVDLHSAVDVHNTVEQAAVLGSADRAGVA